MKHSKIVKEYYKINLETSNRLMPQKLDDFLSGFDFDSLDEEVWCDNHLDIRDFDGDFEGIRIFWCEELKPLYDYLESKIQAEIGKITIEIVCI